MTKKPQPHAASTWYEIAIPAHAFRTGTPASISDSEPEQTLAMDEDPFDSRMSETTRIVYGNSSWGGRRPRRLRSARAP